MNVYKTFHISALCTRSVGARDFGAIFVKEKEKKKSRNAEFVDRRLDEMVAK